MAEENIGWLALGYKMANLPSRCRVYVWRRLEEAGAVRYQQGIALFPKSEWFIKVAAELKDDIIRFGGKASIADISFYDPGDEKTLVKKFNDKIQGAYSEIECVLTSILDEIEKIRAAGKTTYSFLDAKLMLLKKHKKVYDEVKNRDHFKTGYHKPVARLFDSLFRVIEAGMLKAGSENA